MTVIYRYYSTAVEGSCVPAVPSVTLFEKISVGTLLSVLGPVYPINSFSDEVVKVTI